MKVLKIASICINSTPLNFKGNVKNIKRALEDKAVEDSDLVLFPELCLSGYGCEDAFFRNDTFIQSWNALTEILPYSEDRTIVLGLPIFQPPYLYNCMAVIDREKIKCLIPKTNLANTGIHYEKRWFHGASSLFQSQFLSPNDEWIHFGHYILEKSGFLIGVEICEDSWSMNRPAHSYSENGIDILLSPGASHFAIGKREKRLSLFLESSRNQSNLQVFSNLLGNESGRVIYDGGPFFANQGIVVNEGENLSFDSHEFATWECNLTELRSGRTREFRETNPKGEKPNPIPKISLQPLGLLKPNKIRIIDFRGKEKNKVQLTSDQKKDPFIEFTRAVALGLWDYVRKSKTKGYTLSLSGGADSATCAILIALAKKLAIETLGEDGFKQAGFDPDRFLVTIFQGTKNNSETTKTIAKLLAEEVGAIHHEIDIDDQVTGAVSLIEATIQRKITWQTDDLALQNIQARIRSPLVWLIANTENHLLVSTGNRSEASVGYTTMDGDASGSICPLASVSKEFILQWIDHIQLGKNPYISPLSALKLLQTIRPTAELKPLEEKQEDEKDLMPYPLLQKIERNIVYLGLDANTTLHRIKKEEPNISVEEIAKAIQKFQHLFRVSQWKRERLAPSFYLDEYSLDPKSSYRYPILSGE